MTSQVRNPKLSPDETLSFRTRHPANSLNQELMNLELCGHYADDPDSRRLYEAAHSTWGHLRLAQDDEAPDFASRTRLQVVKARELLYEDESQRTELPWRTLTSVIGHGFLKHQLWTAAAESGHGKTTFAMNVVKTLVDIGKRVYVIGLEQAAEVLRVYLAALKLGFSTRYALANRWQNLPPSARGAIEAELLEQENEGELLHFADTDYLTLAGLPAVLNEAQAFGADLVLIDHVHHVRVEGNNAHAEFVKLCQNLSDFAKKQRIPVLAMAQLNRGQGPRDRLRPYLPPDVNSIQMGKVLEQVSSVVLGLFRPLRDDLTKIDRQRIRLGTPVREFLKPNTMAVNVLKSRISGECGDIVNLVYDRGHIRDEGSS